MSMPRCSPKIRKHGIRSLAPLHAVQWRLLHRNSLGCAMSAAGSGERPKQPIDQGVPARLRASPYWAEWRTAGANVFASAAATVTQHRQGDDVRHVHLGSQSAFRSCVDGAPASSAKLACCDCGRVQSCVWPVGAAIVHDCWP